MKPKTMKPYALVLALTVALVAAPSFAQTAPSATTYAAAESPVWEIHFDVQKTFASPLGKLIMKLLKEEEPGVEKKIDEFAKAIGFDPCTAVGHVILSGNSFEKSDVTALVSLGESRGNLEGWILAAPGYKSEQIDNNTMLHSFNTDKGDIRLWCALPRSRTDNRYVLIATVDRETTIRLAKRIAAKGLASSSSKLPDDTLISVRVKDLSAVPIEIDDDKPGSAIVKTIRSVGVELTSAPDTLIAHCAIETDSPARAEQIYQLLTGLKAMIQLAATEDNPDLQKALELANKLDVDYAQGEARVSARFSIEYDVLTDLIQNDK